MVSSVTHFTSLCGLRPFSMLRAGRHIAVRYMSSNEMAYSEQRMIGYSKEQMFAVVENVSEYKEFVPWCRRSEVFQEHPNSKMANLEIGFPPLLESYTSKVTFVKPTVVRSVCLDESPLFKSLETTFKFSDGDRPSSCTLHYDIAFEFRSTFHSHIAHLFFDKVVRTMVEAFLSRAEQKYGKSPIVRSNPTIIHYKS